MRSRIVQIGNSWAIRLPKAVLDRAQLADEVEIEAVPHQIIIRSAHAPREGWDKAFRLMAQREDDRLPDEPVSLTTFDEAEWEW
jgi:antitoxin component of MazEF toxin-antitoxin module